MKILSFLPVILLFSIFSTTSHAQPTLSVIGNYTGTQVWDADTVKVTGDVTINDSLIIKPGTVVEFQGHYGISANVINAIGSAGDSITFTVNDTTGFNNRNIPDGGWKYINTTQYTEFNYCKIMFGKNIDASASPLFDSKGLLTIGEMGLKIQNSVILHNYSITRFLKMDIHYQHNENLEFSACIFQSNTFSEFSVSLSKFSDCIFYDNHGSIENAEAEQSIFEDNSGLGLYSSEDERLYIKDCIFRNNKDLTISGGNGVTTSHFKLIKTKIITNENLLMECRGTVGSEIVGNIICNNTFRESFRLTDNTYPSFSIINNTIYNNRLQKSDDVFITCDNIKLYDNILYKNGDNNPDGIQIRFINYTNNALSSLSGDIRYNNIEGGAAAIEYDGNITGTFEDNIDENPLFTDAAHFDFHISDNSPCINTGTPDITGLSLPATDPDSNPRIFSSRIDIGAYEFQGTPINRPPIIENIREQKILSSSTKLISAKFFDPDPGDHCSLINISSGISQIRIREIADDSSSVRFEIVPDSAWQGAGMVNIRVTDNHGNIGSKEFRVTVSDIVCGRLSENTVWAADTVKIVCDVSIPTGVTLTIQPGTVVTFGENCRLIVSGSITAVGNESSGIIFTSSDTSGFYGDVYNGWGGIDLEKNSAADFKYCNFSYAKGALYCKNPSISSITNCVFYNNYSEDNGGAVYIAGTVKELSNNIFYNNRAKWFGGAVYLDGTNLDIINNLFFHNTAEEGAAIVADHGINRLINNSFVENTSGMRGGGISIYYGSLINCIVWDNESSDGSQVLLYREFNFYNSSIQGGIDSIANKNYVAEYKNNIDADPLFANTARYDFHLSDNSPCINTGTPDTFGLHLPAFDLAGQHRILDAVVDIGACEFKPGHFELLTQPIGDRLCRGNELSLATRAFGGVVGYQWQKEGVNIPNKNSDTLHFAAIGTSDAGNYNCTIITADSIISTDTVQVKVELPAFISVKPEPVVACVGADTVVTLQTAGGNIERYSWLKDGSVLPNENSPELVLPSLLGSDSGIYIGVAGNACGSDSTSAIRVTVNPLPVVDLGGPYYACEGEFVLLTPGNSFTGYHWSTGEEFWGITVTESGSYAVTVTNEYQCENNDSAEVVFYPLPYVFLGEDTTIYTGDTLVLNAGADFAGYQWNTGAENQILQVTRTQTGAFEYWARVTDNNSCTSGDTILVTVEKANAIPGNPPAFDLKVYPNPTSGIVYLEFSAEKVKDVLISVIDIEGRMILQDKLERIEAGTVYSVDLSGLESGIYILMIDNYPVRIVKDVGYK
jgi:hypothetical protein